MKKILIAVLVASFFVSCGNPPPPDQAQHRPMQQQQPMHSTQPQNNTQNIVRTGGDKVFPGLGSLDNLGGNATFKIWNANDVRVGPNQSNISVVQDTKKEGMLVAGIAVDTPNMSEAGGVYAEINGQLFKADLGYPSPGLPNAPNASYRLFIPVKYAGSGNHIVKFYVLNKAMSGYYSTTKQINWKV